jgi:hypothetical protein
MQATMAHSVESLNRNKRIEKLGDIGEQIVARILRRLHKVIRSADKYDHIKDMTVDGLTTEIKTLTYNFSTAGLWLDRKQWKKCDEAKRLFFVKVPFENSPLIEIYECTNKNKHRLVHARECRLYKLTDLQLYETINCVQLARYMYCLSPSKYK